MAWQIYKFDTAMLPVGNNDQQHDPGQVESTLLDSVGGVFDYWGSTIRRPRRLPVEVRGVFVGQRSYEVDEAGNRIVDEEDNYIVSHGADVDLRIQIAALQQLIGKRASLWRRRLDDTSIEQWKTARLVHCPWPQSYEDGAAKAEVSAVFETSMVGWRSETLTTSSVEVNSNVKALSVFNGGEFMVDDAIIRVLASGSNITSVTIECVETGVDLRFTGTIADGNNLYINCGPGTVLNNGVDAYSDFALGSSHTARCWLPLQVGQNPIVVRVTGQGTVYIYHYNQWA